MSENILINNDKTKQKYIIIISQNSIINNILIYIFTYLYIYLREIFC